MSDDEARDRARAVYGRPDPNRPLPAPAADARPADPAPVAPSAPSPAIAAELAPRDDPEAQPVDDEQPEPGRDLRRPVRRGRRVAAATGILIVGAALTAVALVTEPRPSLAVFDREPTPIELAKLEELSRA